MGITGSGNGDCSHALVNLAILCRTLLQDDRLTEPAKAEAAELLEAWMHLAGQSAERGAGPGESAKALLRRMEAFVQARAEQPASHR